MFCFARPPAERAPNTAGTDLPPQVHYHEGMQPGENTLNALCTRVVTRGMAQRGGYTQEGFLQE